MNLLPGKIVETGEWTKIKVDGGGVAVSSVPTNGDDQGMRVNIGVRPEDFTPAGEDDFIYEGKVNITEALGEVTLLYFHPNDGHAAVIGKLPGIHSALRSKYGQDDCGA